LTSWSPPEPPASLRKPASWSAARASWPTAPPPRNWRMNCAPASKRQRAITPRWAMAASPAAMLMAAWPPSRKSRWGLTWNPAKARFPAWSNRGTFRPKAGFTWWMWSPMARCALAFPTSATTPRLWKWWQVARIARCLSPGAALSLARRFRRWSRSPPTRICMPGCRKIWTWTQVGCWKVPSRWNRSGRKSSIWSAGWRQAGAANPKSWGIRNSSWPTRRLSRSGQPACPS